MSSGTHDSDGINAPAGGEGSSHRVASVGDKIGGVPLPSAISSASTTNSLKNMKPIIHIHGYRISAVNNSVVPSDHMHGLSLSRAILSDGLSGVPLPSFIL